MTEDAEQYQWLTKDAGAVWLRREVISAAGEEALTYLQGQLSQDLDSLAIGNSTWAWLLQPHGKVDALIRLTRTADAEFLIDFDEGHSELILERLNRFKLRTKVEFALTSFRILGVRGAKAPEATATSDVVAQLNWPGLSGYDLIGTDPALPAGVALCEPRIYEAVRIEAGVPVLGAEFDQLTIPAEVGINDRAISFTKGCYTGQELVARIDSRGGNVPRHLRLVVIDTDNRPPVGSKILVANQNAAVKPFGTISSVAFSPGLNKTVALAMIRRDVQVGSNGVVGSDDGPVPCRIEKLPLETA